MSFADSLKGTTSEVARHIARVAARLFATQGYEATSVRTIVEEAGVTKPTLYYHFGSKEGLALALLTMPMVSIEERLRQTLDDVNDPVEMLEQTFEAHFSFSREDPDCARFIFALWFGPLGSSLVGEIEKFKGGMNCLMGDIIRRAAEEGVIDPERAMDFAKACHGMILVSTMDFLYKSKELGPDLPRRLVGDLLRGFGNPEAPRRGC